MTAATKPPDEEDAEQAELRAFRAEAEFVIKAGGDVKPESTDEDLDEVLERVAIHPTPEEPMEEERLCPHCSKKLRSHNTRGMCSKCWLKHGRVKTSADKPSAATPRKFRSTGDVEHRFTVVLEALGLEREEVLGELMKGWLDNLKACFTSGAKP